ncbi:hypothetical protein BDA96_08G104700 [Sorghum bicolor]|uniref:Uncharacterized protein n=2 Tax=Sorghum bicolor TaxID=4558 RepID=A0A921QH31_SORBI|nr:hypothetical protein BDA96_08G104700 [Sorghum bicolor]KXG23425.1 hypothetical protein SORBI_3008G093300 [Sorghum bicolor]
MPFFYFFFLREPRRGGAGSRQAPGRRCHRLRPQQSTADLGPGQAVAVWSSGGGSTPCGCQHQRVGESSVGGSWLRGSRGAWGGSSTWPQFSAHVGLLRCSAVGLRVRGAAAPAAAGAYGLRHHCPVRQGRKSKRIHNERPSEIHGRASELRVAVRHYMKFWVLKWSTVLLQLDSKRGKRRTLL